MKMFLPLSIKDSIKGLKKINYRFFSLYFNLNIKMNRTLLAGDHLKKWVLLKLSEMFKSLNKNHFFANVFLFVSCSLKQFNTFCNALLKICPPYGDYNRSWWTCNVYWNRFRMKWYIRKQLRKNPAYGGQSISRPMRIVAPRP